MNSKLAQINTTTTCEILYPQQSDTHKSIKFFFIFENIKAKENYYFQSNQLQTELYTINKRQNQSQQ